MKFKVGDKVKITKAMFKIDKKYEGKVVTIEYVDPSDSDRYMVKENCRPWKGCELELVEESEEIILKGVKKNHNNYVDYIIEVPQKNGYVCSYIGTKEIYIRYKQEILDDIEKKYLRAVINPFRDRVCFIKKISGYTTSQYIKIVLKDETLELPFFKANSMYKGMEENNKYTLEELGL